MKISFKKKKKNLWSLLYLGYVGRVLLGGYILNVKYSFIINQSRSITPFSERDVVSRFTS